MKAFRTLASPVRRQIIRHATVARPTSFIPVSATATSALQGYQARHASTTSGKHPQGFEPPSAADLEELRERLDESKASFAYVRVQYANDKESKREKFIFVVWIGPGCKVMRKAKVSQPFCAVPQYTHAHHSDLRTCGGRQAGSPSLLAGGPCTREG